MSSNIKLILGDCMDLMHNTPDKFYDLAIVDPPYMKELGNPKGHYGSGEISDTGILRKNYKEFTHWEVPNEKYFNELFRVSKQQIIWGCNYYAKYIPHVSRIVWDKQNDSSSFSKCELASKSMNTGIDIYRFMWNGMLQGNMKNKEIRHHPTQKPCELYRWLLKSYAKDGDKILDTHLGSGSIAIACYDMGYDLTGIEIDQDYYNAAVKRLDNHKKQLTLY